MIKQLKKILQKLSKKISRKNLYKDIDFYVNKIKNQENGLESLKVLNVGSGGQIGDYLKSKFNFFYSIDIDKNRNPDQVIDVCDLDDLQLLSFKPKIICMLEVLEHTKDPISAVNNLYEIVDENGYVLLSAPFIFHIHDEPYDFYRFTKFGLQNLFQKFSEVEIVPRNGWFEAILVLFMRLRLEKSVSGRVVGNLFVLVYFLLTPFTYLIQNLIKSDRITTAYFVYAKK